MGVPGEESGDESLGPVGRRTAPQRHAEIQFRSDGTVVLRDLGSRNGTWVNDRRVSAEVALKVNDKIILGAPATTLALTRLES